MKKKTSRLKAGLSLALATLVLNGTANAVVINEIMQNPSAVADSAGEWFELFNPTGSAIDIDGWTIKDNDIDSHVINNGGSLIVPAGGYLILGRNGDSSANGGVLVDYVYGSSFALANGADELILVEDMFSLIIDSVEWDGGPNFPDPNGASMALIDPSLDNSVGSNWATSITTFGDGNLGTPGTANFSQVPVPAPIALIGFGLVGIGLQRRRHVKAT
jgi:hypothetical protein